MMLAYSCSCLPFRPPREFATRTAAHRSDATRRLHSAVYTVVTGWIGAFAPSMSTGKYIYNFIHGHVEILVIALFVHHITAHDQVGAQRSWAPYPDSFCPSTCFSAPSLTSGERGGPVAIHPVPLMYYTSFFAFGLCQPSALGRDDHRARARSPPPRTTRRSSSRAVRARMLPHARACRPTWGWSVVRVVPVGVGRHHLALRRRLSGDGRCEHLPPSSPSAWSTRPTRTPVEPAPLDARDLPVGFPRWQRLLPSCRRKKTSSPATSTAGVKFAWPSSVPILATFGWAAKAR